MKVHQLNCEYAPVQDRILFRVSTDAGMEGQFWLTRRLVKGLWPHLLQPVETELKQVGCDRPISVPALMAAQRQAAMQVHQFDRPYETGQQQCTAQPVLVTAARLTPLADGGCLLGMSEGKGLGMELTLPPDLWHGLLCLLDMAVAHADWSLQPLVPPAPSGLKSAVMRH
jgi:hypothetical protein